MLAKASAPTRIRFRVAEVPKWVTTTCLPLYYPTDEEVADPELYSRNVQRYMADALGCPTCEDWGIEESRALYTTLDARYASKA